MATSVRTGLAPRPVHGNYDLAVIGAGSAGFSAAIRAAELGALVALIGRGTLGGTCVNVGCVPSKTLIRAVGGVHQALAATRFAGIRSAARVENWRSLVAQKDELIAQLREAKYAAVLPAYERIRYLEGPARLDGDGVVVDGVRLGVARVIVATGAAPAVPRIAGIEDVPYLMSTTALALTALPRSLLVLGGGYVGCELAQMFARAGVRVSIVCRSRLLPEWEPEIGEALGRYFAEDGITIHAGAAYHGIRSTAEGAALAVRLAGREQTLAAERVLVATGRRPNSEGLGLLRGGVAVDANGAVRVDEHLRTSRAGVYAAGDVTGRHQFVYMAAYSGKLAAENALNGDTHRYDALAMPAVVFTDPQAASAGLTEAQARNRGLAPRVSVLPLEKLPRALVARDTRGLIKLVAEKHSGRLLGAHLLAPEGADSIQSAVLAIRHGLTVAELADMLFPYLTTVEGLKLAAQAFEKDVATLPCCAG